MTEPRSRDLTGFTAGAPSEAPAQQSDGGSPASDRDVMGGIIGTGAVPDDRVRITLSIPVTTAEALRRASEQEGRFYLDIIGAAFSNHRSDVEESYRRAAGSAILGGHPLRRRRPPGRVQVALVLSAGGLAELDQAADRVGLDRSSYVAELLARHLS